MRAPQDEGLVGSTSVALILRRPKAVSKDEDVRAA
jgi:hypothetical protein